MAKSNNNAVVVDVIGMSSEGAFAALEKGLCTAAVALPKLSQEQVLAALSKGLCTVELASKRLSELAPKASHAGKLSFKVSEKGAVSVYGLQRMPVTLYVEQWNRLIAVVDELKAFLKDNDAKLARKQ